MPHNAFVDSCIFIAYGTEFEYFHPACVAFFEQMNCEKYTSESVEGELRQKLNKREALYTDYSKFLTQGGTDYRASIYLNDNDQRHLEELVRNLANIPAHAKLTFLRLSGKTLRLRINKAKGFIKQVIPRNNDVYFKDIIRSIIINDADSWILNDAVQWSLSINNAVFVTLDSEILDKREELVRKVMDYKGLIEAPMQIIHVGRHFKKS